MTMKYIIEHLKAIYPEGTRVKLLQMEDPQAPPIGTLGTVLAVDAIGSLLIEWDTGSHLNVIYGEDRVSVIHLTPSIESAIEEVRLSGLTNMLDCIGVQRVALELGLFDLVDFIEDYRKEYLDYLKK